MAYAAWSVVSFEVPTTAKWNILGTNDASFHDASGIEIPNNEFLQALNSAVAPKDLIGLGDTNQVEFGQMNRQGGHADNWDVPGTTGYLVNRWSIQAGCVTVPAGGNVTVTFEKAFAENPVGFAIAKTTVETNLTVDGESTTQMTVYNFSGSNRPCAWFAIGEMS